MTAVNKTQMVAELAVAAGQAYSQSPSIFLGVGVGSLLAMFFAFHELRKKRKPPTLEKAAGFVPQDQEAADIDNQELLDMVELKKESSSLITRLWEGVRNACLNLMRKV